MSLLGDDFHVILKISRFQKGFDGVSMGGVLNWVWVLPTGFSVIDGILVVRSLTV